MSNQRDPMPFVPHPEPIAGEVLGRALHREGLLPEECAEVSLHMPVDGLVQLRFTVNVTQDQLPKLLRAIESLKVG